MSSELLKRADRLHKNFDNLKYSSSPSSSPMNGEKVVDTIKNNSVKLVALYIFSFFVCLLVLKWLKPDFMKNKYKNYYERFMFPDEDEEDINTYKLVGYSFLFSIILWMIISLVIYKSPYRKYIYKECSLCI